MTAVQIESIHGIDVFASVCDSTLVDFGKQDTHCDL